MFRRLVPFVSFVLLLAFMITGTARAQTATYHLHSTSSTTSGLLQLTTAGPNPPTSALLTANLRGLATGEYVIKQFDTQTGDPNVSGVIPSGSTLSFTLWMRSTGNQGTMFPRAKLNLNSAIGTSLCIATGTTALTTTLSAYTISCNTTANVTMASTDRFYLWVGINLTKTANTNFNGELDIEGALNGNYDSQITVPLATPAPTLSSLVPSSGAVGSVITIAGDNFRSVQGGSTVKFNGQLAGVSSWNNTTVIATVPTTATTGSVVVTVGGQASNGITFTVTPAPSISNLSPATGAVGATVTIAGSNFGASQGNGTAKFNGTQATVTSWSDTSIVASVPNGATTGNVVVTAAGGVASNGVSFTVVPAPSIGGLTPPSGQVGTSVTITGANFGTTQGLSTVTFNGILATPTAWGAGSIVAPVPAGATTGNVIVNASGVASNGVLFTVPPNISSLSPVSGPVATSVTITGVNFGATQGSSVVTFNNVAGTVLSWSNTSVVALVPSGVALGPGPVVLTVAGVASNGATFTLTPGMTRVSPSVGSVGTSVNIRGTNFGSPQGASTVTFNGVTASPVSWANTSIVAPVPSGVTTGPVVVTVGGYASNQVSFTVSASISSISPISGSSGTSVTISGQNFVRLRAQAQSCSMACRQRPQAGITQPLWLRFRLVHRRDR